MMGQKILCNNVLVTPPHQPTYKSNRNYQDSRCAKWGRLCR